MSIKAFIIDDHPLIREGLKQVLRDTIKINIDGEGGFAEETLRRIAKKSYDIIILNTYFFGDPGITFLKEIKSIRPELPVLVLNMRTDRDFGYRFIKAGASGCLAKECEADELKQAVEKLVDGEKYISPSLAEKIALNMVTEEFENRHKKLSKREFEVMCLIARGKTVKETAKELAVSVQTVGTHRAHIMKKMKMKTNVELAFYVIDQGLLN